MRKKKKYRIIEFNNRFYALRKKLFGWESIFMEMLPLPGEFASKSYKTFEEAKKVIDEEIAKDNYRPSTKKIVWER
jgi:hypothetical protein